MTFAGGTLILLLMSFFLGQEQGVTRGRTMPVKDIDQYDKAGPYWIERSPNGALPAERINRMRSWLWGHWEKRRLGVLIESSSSIEGDRATFYYFVEPDEEGKWRIGIRIERIENNYANLDCKRFEVQEFSAYSVIRMSRQRDANGDYHPIPKKQHLPPSDYLLLLKDREGAELRYF
jgi:hypothetical protein